MEPFACYSPLRAAQMASIPRANRVCYDIDPHMTVEISACRMTGEDFVTSRRGTPMCGEKDHRDTRRYPHYLDGQFQYVWFGGGHLPQPLFTKTLSFPIQLIAIAA